MNFDYRNSSRRFASDERGTVAVLFGLLTVPMVMFVGLAVDYSRVIAADRDLQEAVDGAALAAAIYKMEKKAKSSGAHPDGQIIQGEGKSTKHVAIDYVRNNSTTRYLKNLIPDARESDSDFTLTVSAKAQVPATFARLVVDKIDIEVQAKTRMAGEPVPLCLLGLNNAAPQTVKAWGSGEVIATDCAVLSNSRANDGPVTGGSATMQAKSFCSAGGTSGGRFHAAGL